MAIPIFEQFLYPFLFHLKNKNLSKNEITQCLIEYFHLTKEDCESLTKEKRNKMIDYNVGVSVKKVYEIKRLDTDYFDE